jgi:hypothetical protein
MDKKTPYYGPAGIFSTDNPQSDRMQIEAEEYDEFEWEQDDPVLDEEYYNQPTIYRSFECSYYSGQGAWYDWEECFESDDLEAMTKKMQAKHDEVCDCGQPIKVS